MYSLRSPCGAYCCAAALFLCAPSHGLAQEGGVERVRIRLGAGTIAGTLPFDERFVLVGRAPTGLDSLSLTVMPHAAPTRCAEHARGERAEGAGEEGLARARPWGRHPGLPTDSFYVWVDELAPNREYDFCFRYVRRPTDEELEGRRAGWLAALDSALSSWRVEVVVPPGQWTPAEPGEADVRRLQRELREMLASGESVLPRGGAVSLLGAPPDSFAARLGLPRILELQAQRDQAAWDFARAAERAEIRLDPLAGGDPTGDRLAALRLSVDRQIRAYAALHEDGLAVAAALRLPASRTIGGAARGERDLVETPPDVVPWEPPDSVRSSGSAERRAAHLARTRDQLLDYLAAVEALRLDSATRDLTAIPVSDLAGLSAGVSAALGAVRTTLARARYLADRIARRDRAIERAADRLAASEIGHVELEGTTVATFDTRAALHVAADFGFAYLPDLEEMTPSLGANFYLIPINRDRRLGFPDWWRRFSLTLGITTSSLEEGRWEDLTGSLNLFGGVGIRLLDFLRVGGGGLLLKRADGSTDGDSDSGDASPAVTPYVSLTLDFVLKDVLKDFFGTIF